MNKKKRISNKKHRKNIARMKTLNKLSLKKAKKKPVVKKEVPDRLTKSDIDKSVSCPTAEIIGIGHEKIALATDSSLKGHKSSRDPPPRPTIRRST